MIKGKFVNDFPFEGYFKAFPSGKLYAAMAASFGAKTVKLPSDKAAVKPSLATAAASAAHPFETLLPVCSERVDKTNLRLHKHKKKHNVTKTHEGKNSLFFVKNFLLLSDRRGEG